MPPDRRTKRKLKSLGKKVKTGERESGVWICDETKWWKIGDGKYVYLLKGTRIKGTWEFKEPDTLFLTAGWQLVVIDLETLLAPKLDYDPTRRQRFWWWLCPWTRPTGELHD